MIISKIKTKVKNKEKTGNVKKSTLKKALKIVLSGVIGYTALISASNKLFVDSIKNQVTTEMMSEYNVVYDIISDREKYIDYINNYQYTDDMFKKDQERFNKFDEWIADQYEERLNKYDLSDTKTTKETIIKMLNEDENLFFEKANLFEKIYSMNNLSTVDVELSRIILKIYSHSNIREYSDLSGVKKNDYIIENYIQKKGVKISGAINYYDVSDIYKIFNIKKYAVEKDNIYGYLPSVNMLTMNKEQLKIYSGVKREYSEGQRDIFKLVDNNKKEVEKLKNGVNYEKLSENDRKIISEIIEKNYEQIMEVKIKNTLKLKTDEKFKRESFKNMNANMAFINKLKNVNSEKKSDKNYQNYLKNNYILFPISYIDEKLSENGISINNDSLLKEKGGEFNIMMKLTGVKKEIWKSYRNNGDIIYENTEDYLTFMK